ncbi:MAG: hypothetical protein FJZ57_04745 [Chlamydiae bacterium]|nr:hypothetical protein [Chlamydiota bacterium]
MTTYSPSGFTRNDHRAFAFGHTTPTDQEQYIEKANEKIRTITTVMKRSIENNIDCFSSCLQIASNSRRTIAQRVEQRNADIKGKQYHKETCEFGLSRLKENPNTYHLLLGGVYSEISAVVADSIRQSLYLNSNFKAFIHKIPHHDLKTAATENVKTSPSRLDLQVDWDFFTLRQSCEPFESMSHMLLKNESFNKSFIEFKKKVSLLKDFTQLKSQGEDIARTAQKTIKSLREQRPQFYEKNWNLILLDIFKENIATCIKEKNFPFTITAFAIGSLKYSIDCEESKILTKYITYIASDHNNSEEKILRKINTRPIILLGHQDVTDIEHTLNDAKKLFKQALSWSIEEGVTFLKETVGAMMYLLAHNHREARGSAAESEWIERSIYQAHNFDMVCTQDRMPDLIAFSKFDMDEFLTEYKNSFELKLISK